MKLKTTFFILVLLSGFVQCTVQKRLYNRGYHMECRARFRSEGISKIQDSIPFQSSTGEENDFIAEKELFRGTPQEETDHVTDTAILIVNNGTKRDTIYGQVLTVDQLRQNQKEQRLIGVGIPMVITGAISAAAFSAANNATAAAAILFFGTIGWIFAITAVILMALFLIFLTTSDNSVTDSKKAEPKRGLTKGERIGLIISFTVIAIIAAAFWLKGSV